MNWHERYLHQANWTRELRSYLLQRSGWASAHRVLEVGCGTGAVLASLPQGGPAVYGLDLDRSSLLGCHDHASDAYVAHGNALALPFASRAFDITFCHFLLLWVGDPLQALREMKRVTVPAGYVIAFAEPDYGAREDKPAELAWLGQLQNKALQRQGAALRRGAELAELFQRAGISIKETGLIRGKKTASLSAKEWESEWQAIAQDLAQDLPADELERNRRLDREAMLMGQRVLNVPTYFAWGQV